MKWILILMSVVAIGLLLKQFVPASHETFTMIGEQPIKWWMVGAASFGLASCFIKLR